ncbi:hypothetical protein ACIBCT_35360 [Streptosporangium sp. NPDC050855]|uniref:hypothetical protein n=1 Tax=Streptosporangium sp. NPDC050855 TaxID=3366194 RepID=UPI0037B2E266
MADGIRKSDGARGKLVGPAPWGPEGHTVYEWSDTQPRFTREILPDHMVVNPDEPKNGRWGQVAELAVATGGAALKLGEIAALCLDGGWYTETELDAVRQLDRLENLVKLMRSRVEAARRTQRNA